MKWVVLGDIGWGNFYHLGDEAMTEVAIEQLRRRGASEITLVSAEAATAERLYGCPTVPRIGFHHQWGRQRCLERLRDLEADLSREPVAGTVQYAILAADAVLISGGGNLNSTYFDHLYERVAFARIAKRCGKPLFVTSQTVGPALREEDRLLVAEIADTALAFGAREEQTAKLMRQLTDEPAKVVHTLDDAVLMQHRTEDRDNVAALCQSVGVNLDASCPGRGPILASFTVDSGASGFSSETYLGRVGELLDDLAERNGTEVVLVPHSGDLSGHNSHTDQELNRELEQNSRTGMLKTLPRMLNAREQTALMSAARFSVSSRYHPLVFGTQLGVPVIGIALSSYSTVRMRGALKHVGLERWVVPSTLWDVAKGACDEALGRSEELREHLRAVAAANTEYQRRWWDALVQAATIGVWQGLEDVAPVRSFGPNGTWSVAVEAVTPTYELWGREREQRLQLEEALQELDSWQERAVKAENRRIVRLVDAVFRVFWRGKSGRTPGESN